ncbi:UDP-N-acetylmuramate:L-alanyl-gamma-D-glutamyl-meso-diaminopimelate ligase, partial [Achromatium sp. WMS1]
TCAQVVDIIENVVTEVNPGDHILVMSNGSFDNIHQRLIDALS